MKDAGYGSQLRMIALVAVCVRINQKACMSRDQLERYQVWLYLGAIVAGLAFGNALPAVAGPLEVLLWPVLGLLLYATFTQVPLNHLSAAFRDRRFMGAVLIGNFVAIPLLVWGLLWFAPDDPAIRLGILLVLLVPCTDWAISFTHLGGGDTARAIAAAPVNLLLQIVLLPGFLWLFMGDAFLEIMAADRIALVFVALILLPLLAAFLTERWAERDEGRRCDVARIGWMPVPLLALVVFLIASSQVQAVAGALPMLSDLALLFAAFLVVAALIGAVLSRAFALPTASARALIFSLGTRNSFVVLPLSLALAPEWQAATVVIVFQSLVELFGMVAFLWLVPRLLAPHRAEGRG